MKQIIGVLGLAQRAKKLCFGEIAMRSISSQQAKLIILSEDIGENSKNKYYNKCHYYQIDIITLSSDTIKFALGKSNIKSIAVLDKGFAEKLKSLAKG